VSYAQCGNVHVPCALYRQVCGAKPLPDSCEARHALLTQDKAPQALNAKWVLDRCRAALAAREEPQGHLAEECCPDECPACADETACYVGRTSSDDLADLQACAEEVRDVLVRDTERPAAAREEPQEPTDAEVEAVAAVVRNVWLTDAEGIASMETEASNIARDILSRLKRVMSQVEDVRAGRLQAGDRIAVRIDQVLISDDGRVELVGVEAPSSLPTGQRVTRVRD